MVNVPDGGINSVIDCGKENSIRTEGDGKIKNNVANIMLQYCGKGIRVKDNLLHWHTCVTGSLLFELVSCLGSKTIMNKIALFSIIAFTLILEAPSISSARGFGGRGGFAGGRFIRGGSMHSFGMGNRNFSMGRPAHNFSISYRGFGMGRALNNSGMAMGNQSFGRGISGNGVTRMGNSNNFNRVNNIHNRDVLSSTRNNNSMRFSDNRSFGGEHNGFNQGHGWNDWHEGHHEFHEDHEFHDDNVFVFTSFFFTPFFFSPVVFGPIIPSPFVFNPFFFTPFFALNFGFAI